MVMSWIFTGMIAVSLVCSLVQENTQALAASVLQGAQAGVTLAISIGGSLCLWSGVGKLLEAAGITDLLSKLLRPVLHRLFPGTKSDPELSRKLSSNICANLLGLGNAATPMGIQAVKRLADPRDPHSATDEMCRLVVLNTASIQLIPSTVAAIRSGLECPAPFDILPAVWVTSLTSAGAGLAAVWLLGRWRRHA